MSSSLLPEVIPTDLLTELRGDYIMPQDLIGAMRAALQGPDPLAEAPQADFAPQMGSQFSARLAAAMLALREAPELGRQQTRYAR